MTFSRGLSTGWLRGTNHPYLTHGKWGKKRGPRLSTIAHIQEDWITLAHTPDIPLQPGDGIVIDQGENRDHEQGGQIWQIDPDNPRRLRFHHRSGIDMHSLEIGQALHKTSDPQLEKTLRQQWQKTKLEPETHPLQLTITGSNGQPLTIHAQVKSTNPHQKDAQTTVHSQVPLSPAQKRPLDTATLHNQLSRLGNTPYHLHTLNNQLKGQTYLPVSELNRLRRALTNQLETQQTPQDRPTDPRPSAQILKEFQQHQHQKNPQPEPPNTPNPTPQLSLLARTPEQLQAALNAHIPTIYLDYEDPRRFKQATEQVREHNHHLRQQNPHQSRPPESQLILATPRIIKSGETGYLKQIAKNQPHGILIRNLAALEHFKNHPQLIKIGDFSLNVANPLTAHALKTQGQLQRLTISYDLNASQVLDLLNTTPSHWLELTLHQHMPLFHMEHCVFCTFMSEGTSYLDCGRPCEKHQVHLRDRVGQLHRLTADVGCRNTLFNGRAQTGAAYLPAFRQAGLQHLRIELLDETQTEAQKTITAYQNLLSGKTTPQEHQQTIQAQQKLGVTQGTLDPTP